MYVGIYVKHTLFFTDFNETRIFSISFWKILKYKILWRSVQWELSFSMQADERTDRDDKAHRPFFCNFAKSSKNKRKRISPHMWVKEFWLCPRLVRNSCYKLLCCIRPSGPHVYSKGFEYYYNFSGCVDSPPSAWFPLLLLLLLLLLIKCKLI